MDTQLTTNENKDIVYSSFLLKKNGLEAIGKPTFEQWQECGKFIRKAQGAVHFWIGDWLNYGEHNYGETYTQAIDHTSYDYQTVANDKWLSSKIPLSLRKETISINHYQTIASLDDKKSWVDRIEKNNWSVAQLKQYVKAYKAKEIGRKSIEVKASLYGDNIYFNSSEKSDVRWDDHVIKDSD